jgi:alpha-glucosidase (family GH31 glycosyl hydrolase)
MLSLGGERIHGGFRRIPALDCVLHDGAPALLHNRWPVLWAKLNREAVEEFGDPDVMFFSRAGYSGVQQYAPVMWNGDQHVDFTPDYGMPCVMPASFSLGFSGVPLVHCDVGGFFSFMAYEAHKRSASALARVVGVLDMYAQLMNRCVRTTISSPMTRRCCRRRQEWRGYTRR